MSWEDELDEQGFAVLDGLLAAEQCAAVTGLYIDYALFRNRVVMVQHGFGWGEYKYFQYPLQAVVAELRPALYPRLAPVANRWYETMGLATRFPPEHADFLARCQ